jgi:hypothetical protein
MDEKLGVECSVVSENLRDRETWKALLKCLTLK